MANVQYQFNDTVCDLCKSEQNICLTIFLHGHIFCIDCAISYCKYCGIPYTVGFIDEGVKE